MSCLFEVTQHHQILSLSNFSAFCIGIKKDLFADPNYNMDILISGSKLQNSNSQL